MVILLKKYCILLSEDFFTFTNIVDPDEMPRSVAFHLGLHCLQKYLFRGYQNTKGFLNMQIIQVRQCHANE